MSEQYPEQYDDQPPQGHERAEGGGGRKPDYIAYNVRDGRDGKGHFSRIGAAWQHRDGQGYDIHLDSLPVSGRVTLRELREERMQGYEDERQSQSQDQGRSQAPGQTQDRSRGHGHGRGR
jgi:hypothetical protein